MDSALSGKTRLDVLDWLPEPALMSKIMTFGPVLDLCCFYAETMLSLCRFGFGRKSSAQALIRRRFGMDST